MPKSGRMVALGRKGGAVGGRARARTLTPHRRKEIARTAAQARWRRPVLARSTDLASLVAHAGSKVALVRLPESLERCALQALAASRRNSSMARMLPVFLWRARHRLDLEVLVREAVRRHQVGALGYFLELTAELGGTRVFRDAVESLRASPGQRRRCFFFLGTRDRPFERAAAEAATPDAARRWGLIMNLPQDSFASYFEKTAHL